MKIAESSQAIIKKSDDTVSPALYSITLSGLFRALDAENAKAKYNDSTKKQKITLKKVIFVHSSLVIMFYTVCQNANISLSVPLSK